MSCEYCELNDEEQDCLMGEAYMNEEDTTLAVIRYVQEYDLFALLSLEMDIDYGIIHGCEPPIKNFTAVTIIHCPWCGAKLEVPEQDEL